MISLRDVVTGFGNRDPLAEVWRRDLRGGGSSAEITGTLPLYFSSKGKPLTDYLISGNTVQSGTPSSVAPVDVAGCGVRTRNLWSGGNVSIAVGDIYKHTPIDFPNNTYTFKAKYSSTNTDSVTIGFYDENDTIHTYNMTQIDGAVSASYTGIITAIRLYSAAGYTLSRSYSADFVDIMLNAGDTALQYEPYGYKLPLTVNGTEYPIYLGQVETTRRIKKLVLTGEESLALATTSLFTLSIPQTGMPITGSKSVECTHFVGVPSRSSYSQLYADQICVRSTGTQIWIRSNDISSVADFKSYLAAQYAAGTPVTVWYVLAEPETGIVNEPLMKIGDYADTVSFTQAGVTIPTVSGANVLDMTSPVKPSEVYIKGNGIKPTNDTNFENGG